MMDLEVRENDNISRSSVLRKLDSFHPDYTFNIASFKNLIKAEPTVEKKGKWIFHEEVKNIYGGKYIECSECGEKYVVQYIEDEKFCRNCGAKMERKEE